MAITEVGRELAKPVSETVPPWITAVADALEAKAEAIDHAVIVASKLDGMFEGRRELDDALRSFLDLMRVEVANLQRQADGLNA